MHNYLSSIRKVKGPSIWRNVLSSRLQPSSLNSSLIARVHYWQESPSGTGHRRERGLLRWPDPDQVASYHSWLSASQLWKEVISSTLRCKNWRDNRAVLQNDYDWPCSSAGCSLSNTRRRLVSFYPPRNPQSPSVSLSEHRAGRSSGYGGKVGGTWDICCWGRRAGFTIRGHIFSTEKR